MSSGHAYPALSLRPPTPLDVPLMYAIGCDPVSCEMAGVKPRTREAFEAVHRKASADPRIVTRVIEMMRLGAASEPCTGEFVGSISVFQAPLEGSTEERDNVGYWLAREHWSKGIASRALAMFLQEEPRRPLHATAAMSNLASHRVLLRNGFRFVNRHMCAETERYLAREVGEFVLE